MAMLDERLSETDVRLLTLVGPGGIGKTRLAMELGAIHGPRFADGAYLVPLVATTSWDGCVAAIAQAVGLVASEQSGSVEEQLQRYLKGKTMLLILDNVEQLKSDAAHFVDLLGSAPGLSIIATSRVRLGMSKRDRFHGRCARSAGWRHTPPGTTCRGGVGQALRPERPTGGTRLPADGSEQPGGHTDLPAG